MQYLILGLRGLHSQSPKLSAKRNTLFVTKLLIYFKNLGRLLKLW